MDLTKKPSHLGKVKIADINPHPVGPVTIEDREGVFAFVMKCPACALEFVTLSWRAERPAEIAYACPECQSGVTILGRTILSARREFSLSPADLGKQGTTKDVEIYSVGGILERAAEPPLAIVRD